MGLKTNFV